MATWFKIGRWGLLLPAAPVCYIIIHAVALLFLKLTSYISKDPWSDAFIENVVAPSIAGYCAVIFPLHFFPDCKRLATVILCSALAIAYGVMLGFAIFSWTGSSMVATVFSALFSAVAGYQDWSGWSE
jgi:hypothetical protein